MKEKISLTFEEIDLLLLALSQIREYLQDYLKDWYFEFPEHTELRYYEDGTFAILKNSMSMVDELESRLGDLKNEH